MTLKGWLKTFLYINNFFVLISFLLFLVPYLKMAADIIVTLSWILLGIHNAYWVIYFKIMYLNVGQIMLNMIFIK